MQAVIMAGGKGTRLLNVTKDEIPKPMVPVHHKPLLLRQIEQFKQNGIFDIILITGHLGEKIRDYFKDGAEYGVRIQYIEEKEPLGTAGAFALLAPFLIEKSFFLVFGDVLFDINLSRMLNFHHEKNALATLFVHPNTHPFDSDIIVSDKDGRVTGIDAKNNIRSDWYFNSVNAGFYLFQKEICQFVPKAKKTDLEKELLSGLIAEKKPIFAYRSPEYIKDIGTVERLNKAEEELRSGYSKSRNLSQPQRAVFLDRDGTINQKNGLVFQPEQFVLEDGAIDAIQFINQSGYLAIVITNQPVVARGLCSMEDVDGIHKKMETLLGQAGAYLDGVYFCPHHPDKGYPEEKPEFKISCHCRKPDIGMLEACKEQFNVNLEASWFVGDTTTDIQTGKNAGTKTVLVLTGDAGQDRKYDAAPDYVCGNLLDAVNKILESEK